MCYAFIIGYLIIPIILLSTSICRLSKHKTNTCLYSQSKTCEDQYVVINNDNIQCIYNHDYNICIAGHNTCTEINNYNKAGDVLYITMFLLFRFISVSLYDSLETKII